MKEEKEKDNRASIKMPHLLKAKIAVLASYYQKPMYVVLEGLVEAEIKKLGLKTKSDYG